MSRIMYDSVDVSALPDNGDLYAGYVAGKWPTFKALQQRFPNRKCVSIAIACYNKDGSYQEADVLDVEPGDAPPQLAPLWAKQMRMRGRIPTVYTLYSWWPNVRSQFRKVNEPEPNWWIAKYDNVANLLPDTVAKQYGGANNVDYSVVADFWPGIDLPPQGDIMRSMEAVTVPPPDSEGVQYVTLPQYQFDLTSSVQVKANDNGIKARAAVQPFKGFQGILALSFFGLDGGQAEPGQVALIVEHR